jgi:hypothetical protein
MPRPTKYRTLSSTTDKSSTTRATRSAGRTKSTDQPPTSTETASETSRTAWVTEKTSAIENRSYLISEPSSDAPQNDPTTSTTDQTDKGSQNKCTLSNMFRKMRLPSKSTEVIQGMLVSDPIVDTWDSQNDIKNAPNTPDQYMKRRNLGTYATHVLAISNQHDMVDNMAAQKCDILTENQEQSSMSPNTTVNRLSAYAKPVDSAESDDDLEWLRQPQPQRQDQASTRKSTPVLGMSLDHVH